MFDRKRKVDANGDGFAIPSKKQRVPRHAFYIKNIAQLLMSFAVHTSEWRGFPRVCKSFLDAWKTMRCDEMSVCLLHGPVHPPEEFLQTAETVSIYWKHRKDWVTLLDQLPSVRSLRLIGTGAPIPAMLVLSQKSPFYERRLGFIHSLSLVGCSFVQTTHVLKMFPMLESFHVVNQSTDSPVINTVIGAGTIADTRLSELTLDIDQDDGCSLDVAIPQGLRTLSLNPRLRAVYRNQQAPNIDRELVVRLIPSGDLDQFESPLGARWQGRLPDEVHIDTTSSDSVAECICALLMFQRNPDTAIKIVAPISGANVHGVIRDLFYSFLNRRLMQTTIRDLVRDVWIHVSHASRDRDVVREFVADEVDTRLFDESAAGTLPKFYVIIGTLKKFSVSWNKDEKRLWNFALTEIQPTVHTL